MNEQDVIKELRSLSKPYLYVPNVSQSRFSNILRQYEAGLVKPKTLEGFLKIFGFEKENGLYIQKRIVCTERKSSYAA